jgi:hypothetical protein
MSWEFVKFRIRKRAERAVIALSSYIHSGDEEENPEKNLEEHLRQKARLREYEGGI